MADSSVVSARRRETSFEAEKRRVEKCQLESNWLDRFIIHMLASVLAVPQELLSEV
jgi:hypothetical protein